MTRMLVQFLAAVVELVGIPMLVLGSLLIATLVALGWYFWPAWIPRRLPRLGRLFDRIRRWRRRRAERRTGGEPVEMPDAEPEPDGLPDAPADALLALADRLAAEGRYAEAVRQRLRATVRGLVDAGVIENRPGWTVTELAAAAALARPVTEAPLTAACGIFSEIWYGLRPALREHDDRMRTHVEEVRRALAGAATERGEVMS